MSDASQVVQAVKLTKTYGQGQARIDALRNVDLTIKRGEFVAVMGPSGSGKSTLLHLIGGLDIPSSGRVVVDGQDLEDLDDDRLTILRRKRFGFVFQAFNLLEELTARENVALPLAIDGVREQQAGQRAMVALQQVGLPARENHFVSQLSGGEQQRLAIARALVTEPLLLLADEPTGNLDSANSDQLIRMLRELVDRQQQTILMVTHDARQAAIADRVVHLRDGQIVDQQQMHESRGYDELIKDLEPKP